MKLSEKKQKELRSLALDNLFFLAKGVLGFDQVTPDFHGPICSLIERRDIRRKAFCVPRGFFKTTLVTISSAIQETLRNPNCSQLIACQQQSNAATILNRIRNLWERRTMLQALFPKLVPTGDRPWSSERACINRPGDGPDQKEQTYESAGIGTSLQSRHYDVIRADDLVVAKKDQTTGTWMQPSEEDIQKAIGWHQMTHGLMRSITETKYYQVMTRWSPDDLWSYLTEEESTRWTFLERSAVDEDGNATFPEKFPLEELENLRQDMGAYKYATQFLSEPGSPEHLLFKDKFNLYTPSETPKREDFRRIYMSCDPAIGKKESHHPTALPVVGYKENGERWVLDCIAEKGMPPSLIIDEIFRLWKKHRFHLLILETVAYQESLKYSIDDRFEEEGKGRLFRVKTVTPSRGQKKPARIEGMETSFEKGWWYVPTNLSQVRQQLQRYPFSTFDDILDALAFINTELPRAKGINETQTENEQVDHSVVTYEDIMKRVNKTNQTNSFYDYQEAY